MSTVPQRLLTEQEYLARERKADFKSEFYRGETFAMAGASREHNLIAVNISRVLGNQLADRPCEVYQSDMKVRVRTGLITYPDVVVGCGELKFADDEKDVLLNPIVVFEVLSESTANYDCGGKTRHYWEMDSLREFLLVDQHEPYIEHFARDDQGGWHIRSFKGLDAGVELTSIGYTLRLADVYAKVQFRDDARPLLRPTKGVAP